MGNLFCKDVCKNNKQMQEMMEKMNNVDDIVNNILKNNLQDMFSKIDNIEYNVKEQKSSFEQTKNSIVYQLLKDREQDFKDSVREFMLENCNIEFLNDDIEGNIYDFITDKIWDLILKRFETFNVAEST